MEDRIILPEGEEAPAPIKIGEHTITCRLVRTSNGNRLETSIAPELIDMKDSNATVRNLSAQYFAALINIEHLRGMNNNLQNDLINVLKEKRDLEKKIGELKEKIIDIIAENNISKVRITRLEEENKELKEDVKFLRTEYEKNKEKNMLRNVGSIIEKIREEIMKSAGMNYKNPVAWRELTGKTDLYGQKVSEITGLDIGAWENISINLYRNRNNVMHAIPSHEEIKDSIESMEKSKNYSKYTDSVKTLYSIFIKYYPDE